MRVRVIKTRPPFDHAKHIRLMGKTLLMWFPFYLMAYAWHRFGPTKSVSYVSTEGFHQMEAYSRADADLTPGIFQGHSISDPIPQIHVGPDGSLWYWSVRTNRWMPMASVGAQS